MTENTSFIVNEKRLPATVKRLFRGTVYEIVGELLQNAQRAGAKEIRFFLDRDVRTITIRDNGSGVASDIESWAKILRMADSFYKDESVESNQNPMGLGLLSLFALESVESVRLSSLSKTVLIETSKLWEAENYWGTWTELIEDAPRFVDGFEIVIKTSEPETLASHGHLAHKFEYALTTAGDHGRWAAPRGCQGFLKVFLDGREVDASIPKQFTPSGENLVIETSYQGNRLKIGQSFHDFAEYGYVVWYGQIIKTDSSIPFLLEVVSGSPVTPLAPTRNSLVKDQKLEDLKRFVEDTVFNALGGDVNLSLRMKPQFIKKLHRAFPARAKNELPVCVVREITAPVDGAINCYANFYDLGAEKVLSYSEIEKDKIEIFQSSVACSADEETHNFYRFGFNNHLSPSGNQENNSFSGESNEWLEIGEGLASFAGVLGGTTRQFVVGNTAKFPLKKIYWKTGTVIEKFFVAAGEFAVVPVESDPQENDFRPVTEQVFVFEYTGNFDIEEVDGLRVGIPAERTSDFTDEAILWLASYAKACYSPSDDYDYDSQEEDFDDSISRLTLELRGDTVSTDWKFSEIKAIIEKIISEKPAGSPDSPGNRQANIVPSAFQIKSINFPPENGTAKIIVELADKTKIPLKIAAHTYLK